MALYTIYVRDDEKSELDDLIKAAAELSGRSKSQWVRLAIINQLSADGVRPHGNRFRVADSRSVADSVGSFTVAGDASTTTGSAVTHQEPEGGAESSGSIGYARPVG